MDSCAPSIDLDLPSMDTCLPDIDIHLPSFVPTPPHIQELERLGDQIAELAAHLDAATARLLDLIREFDAREGWGNGFRSCADWLCWRIGLSKNTARHHVRVARALEKLPQISRAFASGEISYSKGPGRDACCDAGHRRAAARGRPQRDRGARGTHRARMAPHGPES